MSESVKARSTNDYFRGRTREEIALRIRDLIEKKDDSNVITIRGGTCIDIFSKKKAPGTYDKDSMFQFGITDTVYSYVGLEFYPIEQNGCGVTVVYRRFRQTPPSDPFEFVHAIKARDLMLLLLQRVWIEDIPDNSSEDIPWHVFYDTITITE